MVITFRRPIKPNFADGGKPSSPTHAEGNMAAMRSLDTTPRADISLPRGRERR